MSPAKGRTQPCGKAEARTRLTQARAFIDTAVLVLDVDDDATPNVAVDHLSGSAHRQHEHALAGRPYPIKPS